MFFIVSLPVTNLAQNDSSAISEWFPLQTENQWQYRVHRLYATYADTSFMTVSVEGDSVMPNNLTYNVLRSIRDNGDSVGIQFLRWNLADSTLYEYTDSANCQTGEFILGDFRHPTYDFWSWTDCRGFEWLIGFFAQGADSNECHAGITNDFYGRDYWYTKHLGLRQYQEEEGQIFYSEDLVWANINGNEWGEYYTGIESENIQPKVFGLTSGFPNPFNSQIAIEYEVPMVSKSYSIDIYSINGQLIYRHIFTPKQTTGKTEITWSTFNNYRQMVASGVYLCVLIDERGRIVGKAVKISLLR